MAMQTAQSDFSATSLKFFHSLGFRQLPSKTIEHVTDESIVYLVGKHVGIFNCENKTHRFILKSPKTTQIVAFCVSPNRRYIALSERLVEDQVQVVVYAFSTAAKVRAIPFSPLCKQPAVSMNFSRDNKYLIAATEAPNVKLFLWQLDKAKLVTMSDCSFPIVHSTISPHAHWHFCTTGPDSVRVWQFSEKNLKQMDPMSVAKKEYKYTCHAWFAEESLVVGTEEGDILVVAPEGDKPMELRETLENAHGAAGVWAIACIGRGFVAGGDDGTLTLYERTFQHDFFRIFKKLRTPQRGRIVDLSISLNEESVVCCYNCNEMVSFSLANVDLWKEEGDTNSCRNLPIGFHSDAITALDSCPQKSIIVTASADKHVRVWNFAKKRMEVVKKFDEEALSVACHPTGLRIVVGFKYRMCLYNLLANDLHQCSDFPLMNCREVKFSRGGGQFAAAIVNRILIFNANTFECVGSLGGHTSLVKSICWARNDLEMVTAGFEGAVYSWRQDGTGSMCRDDNDEHMQKSCAYSCICYDDNAEIAVAIGSNKVPDQGMREGEVCIRQLKKTTVMATVMPNMISLKTATKTHTGELALCSTAQTLFVGTPTGTLLLYKWPLPDGAQPYQKYEIHQGEIVFVHISHDECHLFTCGDDGSLFMFDLDVLVEGRPPPKKNNNFAAFEEVTYVLQGELDEKRRGITTLETKLEEIQREKESELSLLQRTCKDEVTKLQEESLRLKEKMETQVKEAVLERDRAKNEVVANEKHLESLHMKAAEELEALYSKRTDEQQAKYQQLKEEGDSTVLRYENKLFTTAKEASEEKHQLVVEAASDKQQLLQEITSLKESAKNTKEEYEFMIDEMSRDYENEIEEIKREAQERAFKEASDLTTARSETAVFKKKFDGLNQTIKDLNSHKEEQSRALEKKDKRIADCERAINALKVEINVRNDTISNSEKKILELKKQTAELEKLRYVLSFKFNELRKEVAPKEEQIKFMNERIQEMDEELEKVGIDRDTLKQTVSAKDEKLHVMQKNIKSSSRVAEDRDRVVGLLLSELADLVADNEPKTLVHSLKQLITRYNDRCQDKEDPAQERDKTQEFERQRDYMESQLAGAKKQANRKEEHLRHDNMRKTSENALLVKEINDLRHEKKWLGTKLAFTEAQLKEAKALAQQQQTRTGAPAAGATGQAKRATSGEGDGGKQWAKRADRLLQPASRSPARPTGKLMKGSTRSAAAMDPKMVAGFLETVERNNAEIATQRDHIRRLTDFVQKLLQKVKEQGGQDMPLDPGMIPDHEIGEDMGYGGEMSQTYPPLSTTPGAEGARDSAAPSPAHNSSLNPTPGPGPTPTPGGSRAGRPDSADSLPDFQGSAVRGGLA